MKLLLVAFLAQTAVGFAPQPRRISSSELRMAEEPVVMNKYSR